MVHQISEKNPGCFVLISNVPSEGLNQHSSYDVLRAYKDQYGIEQNFGFLIHRSWG